MAEVASGEARHAQPTGVGSPRFWLIASVVTLALFGLYWTFIRTVYVPVLVDIDPQNAADVAKVLDEKAIAYRFDDNGRTIAVVADQADKARVELAGSELPMRGQIGFELFNQSDMGLTEFAQKINFLRALQGELARTILLFEGIQSVRVHLGLPERGLFSSEQSPPKAAVTLILKPGKTLSAASVTGIQQLVAGAVPEMSADAVAVLDGTGRVVSSEVQSGTSPDGTSDAVVESVRQRLTGAIVRTHADLRFGANVSLRYAAPAEVPGAGISQSLPALGTPGERTPRGVPDFSYVIRITTEQPLADGLRNELQRLIGESTDFSPAHGDTLAFLVGPIVTGTQPLTATATATGASDERIVSRAKSPPSAPSGWPWLDWWIILPATAVLAVVLALWNSRRRALTRRTAALTDFSELLRKRLELDGGT